MRERKAENSRGETRGAGQEEIWKIGLKAEGGNKKKTRKGKMQPQRGLENGGGDAY